MRDHDGVETPQIHPELRGVAREYLRVVAGIEENSASTILDERSIAPVFQQGRLWPEGVVENRDLRWLLRFDREERHHYARDRDRHTPHGIPPRENRQGYSASRRKPGVLPSSRHPNKPTVRKHSRCVPALAHRGRASAGGRSRLPVSLR